MKIELDGVVTEVTEVEEAGDQDELRRQLEQVQKQAQEYKQQLKAKEEEAQQYKEKLNEINKSEEET